MANILGLALKVTGDASGLAKSLTPVDRALDNLAKQAERATAVFAPLTGASANAAAAQEKFADRFAKLAQQLKDGTIAPKDYADAFGKLTDQAKAAATAFEEGARITAEVRTEEERRVDELARLEALLSQGAISQETFVRASERATGVEQKRADAAADAARIIKANLSPQEQYDQQIQKLADHLAAGRITQEQYNRAAAKAKADLHGVGDQAAKTDKNIDSLNRNVKILAGIEVGRLIVDGLTALSNVFTSVTSNITTLVSNVNSSVDSLNDFSTRTGIGVEALQGYSLAAKLAGVDTEQFGTAVQRLAVNIGRATPGDQLDKSLRGINLSVAELRQLAPEQQFSVIGQAISQLPTAAERAAVAVELFGKQGAALAPLFREGAASLEELRARAERLGIIVDETQVNNVAAMNDAFDLVRATIEGITGQVIGNLAPAVTEVTEQFLRFVEEWSGAQGQGGVGIANAITNVLLQGAEYFAGIFDKFVANFGGFSQAIETSSSVFSTVANVFTAVTETLRIVFNSFEQVGNLLALALGKALEGLGSYLSEELQMVGQEMVRSSQQALRQNEEELVNAATNVGNAVSGIFGGEQGAEQNGAGQAGEFIKGLRERIERERAPQFKIETNIEKTRERFDSFFNGIADESSRVTDAMRSFEAVVASVVDPLNMTEEEIKRIEEAQRAVNNAIDAELAARQQAAEAATKQAEEDGKRIENLLKANDAEAKLAEDIAAVEREQVRVQEQLNAARQAGETQQANASAARLAQLDQLQASLQEQQQAAEQGFGEGFAKAFEATSKGVDDLIVKAQQFGNVGALAAQALEQGIAQAQQQARDGLLTQETYQKEVARQQDLFNQRLAAAQRVEDFLASKLNDRQRAELEAAKQLEERKKQAAVNLQAIEAKILSEKQAQDEARDKGDLKSARAAQGRITQLKQAQRIEQAIADGRAGAEAQQGRGVQAGINRLQFAQSVFSRQNEVFARSFQNTYAGANAAINAANAAAEAQARKLQQLLTPGPRTVQGADIRTAEGAALVLGLIANEQDPALIEARQQTKQLRSIQQAIVGAVAQYVNTPVEIA